MEVISIKRGQVALEFIIMVGLAFMIMILFLVASAHEVNDINNQKSRVLLKDVVFRTQQEINLASDSLSGYQREFTNPDSLDGINYDINNTISELVGYTEDFEFLLIIPTVNGSAKLGKNVIMNVNGLVCLNQGCSAFDTTPPSVLSVLPTNTTIGVDLDDEITVEFNEDMDYATILASFFVSGVSGSISYNDTFYIATFTPDAPLAQNTTFTATVNTDAKDIAGNRLNNTYQWTFTTGLDTTIPGTVTGLAENETGSTYITWEWTNPTDIDFAYVELWLNGGYVTNTSGTNYTFSGLTENTTYELSTRTVDVNANINTNWVNDTANTTLPQTLFVDLWEMWADRPNPVDFTSGLNTTANTFGLGLGDDGWDNFSHSYDGGSVYYGSPSIVDIVEFDATGGNLEITLGGFGDPSPKGPAYNDPISAAYGVEFTISPAMMAIIDSGGTALLEFDWESEDDSGIEHAFEVVWLKGRFGNSSGYYYLGTDLDSDSNPADDDDMDAITDSTNDIYYKLQPSGADATGHFSLNVSPYITYAGNYYLDLGAKFGDWSAANEKYRGRYDNINITIS